MKALIVDDSQFMRATIKQAISDLAEDISEAGDMDSALNNFREKKPDIVFLDIMMQESDTGVYILQEMKNIDESAKIVVVSSLEFDNTLIKRAFKMGIDGFVQKPFKAEQIRKFMQ